MLPDTLKVFKTVIDTVVVNQVDFVNKVDTFYNSAWSKLLVIGSVGFAVIGIIMPLIIQWYQQQNLKVSEEKLKDELDKNVAIIKGEVKTELLGHFDNKFAEYEKKFDIMKSSADAKAFHLQGNTSLNQGNYRQAYCDFILSAGNYFKCTDFANLRVVMGLINEVCLPKLKPDDINEGHMKMGINLPKLIEKIEKADNSGSLRALLQDTQLRLSKMLKAK